jgi:anti-sigma regulatory factor (Ser/Thr protein kinase)
VAAETAVLLASELVTNAVVHTRSAEVGLVAKCDGDTLLVAVYDEAPASPISGEGVTTGTGIELVDSLADRWGWERLPAGKRVWFEVSCAERRDTTSGGGVAPDRCCETTA